MNALAKTEVIENKPSNALTPMDIVERALASGEIDMFAKAMDLYERWEKNQARKLFDEAVAAAKAEIPPITRSATGHNSKRYADFAAIAKVVDPIISKHGLGYRFNTVQDERINVTCVLFHKAGHCEQTTLSGPADTTGNKNAIQAIGSTLTYLQRYSLVQMLGLAASDDDDAAAANGGGFINEEQAQELSVMMTEAKADTARFLKYLGIEQLGHLPTKRFTEAVNALKAKAGKK